MAAIEEANAKSLPQVLQGSVLLQVNAGVMEFAETFLAGDRVGLYPPDHVGRLKVLLGAFLRTCEKGLRVCRTIVGPDQLELQTMMEVGMEDLRRQLAGLIK